LVGYAIPTTAEQSQPVWVGFLIYFGGTERPTIDFYFRWGFRYRPIMFCQVELAETVYCFAFDKLRLTEFV
jgi:hypothetical protein